MNEINTSDLLSLLISKTKNHSLHWNRLSEENIHIKSLPTSPLKNTITYATRSIAEPHLSESQSYVSAYKNGYFFLLFYKSLISDSTIELRAQTKFSDHSELYAETTPQGESVQGVAQLIRLYNLVDGSLARSEVTAFVHDFMSEENPR